MPPKNFPRPAFIDQILPHWKRLKTTLLIKEEASRGYFDDFKELKDKQGKIFGASHTLIPIPEAATVPAAKVLSRLPYLELGENMECGVWQL